MTSSQPALNDAPDSAALTREEGPAEGRRLRVSLAVSLALHGLLLGLVLWQNLLRAELKVEIDPSAGIAFATRIGLQVPLESLDGDEGQPPPVDLQAEADTPPADEEALADEDAADDALPEEEPAPVEERTTEAPVAEQDVEQAAEPEPAQDAPRPEPPAAVADASASVAPRPPRPRRPVAPAPAPEAPPVAPQDLPPAARYPEGVRHPIATDVSMWGPEGARLVAIVRADRIAASPHRGAVETLLAALPDWQMLLGGADIRPFDDVRTLLIASADPRYLNQTFLAVTHNLAADSVITTLAASYPGGVQWSEERGRVIGRPRASARLRDPRVFVLAHDDLFLFARPEFLGPLLADAAPARGLRGALGRAEAQEGGRTLDAAVAAAPDGRLRLAIDYDERAGRGGDQRERDAVAAALGGLPTRDGGQAPPPGGAEPTPPGGGRPRVALRRPDAEGGATDPGPPAPPTTPSAGNAPARPQVRRVTRPVVTDEGAIALRSGGWLAGLERMASLAGAEAAGPALLLSANGIREVRIAGQGQAEGPEVIHVSVVAGAEVDVRGRLVFADNTQARAFVQAWPAILRANALQLRMVGLAGALQATTWEIDHNEATFAFVIEERTLQQLSTTVYAIMQARLGR